MMRERRSVGVRYRATPAHAERLKALAEESRRSVSTLIYDFILDHIREKLSVEQDPERKAALQRAIESSTGPLKWPSRAPVVRHYSPGGFVYFLRCGGFYKIGRAKSLQQRFVGYPFPEKPRLIKAVRCVDYGFLEKALHALFAHKRTQGEWFDLSDDDVMQAKQYMDSRSKT